MKRFALLLLFLWPLPALADFPARVVGVSDGDTLTVLTAEKRQVKLRLHAVDAPESGQPFGSRAKQAASEMAFGKQVTVREMDTDRYGRTVAEVFLPDGKSLNREMVRVVMPTGTRNTPPQTANWPRSKPRRRRRNAAFGASPVPCRHGIGAAERAFRPRQRSWGTAGASSSTRRIAGARPR